MMKTITYTVVLVAVMLFTSISVADDVVVSVDEVRAMQARLPEESSPLGKPSTFASAGQAKRIAEVISRHVKTYKQAALAVTYAAYESGNRPEMKGDHDQRTGVYHSFGAWQLGIVWGKPEVLQDPDQALVIWLRLVETAYKKCHYLPWDERMAFITSGNCGAGRKQARTRDQIAERILPPDLSLARD